jgi:hypothetical protein
VVPLEAFVEACVTADYDMGTTSLLASTDPLPTHLSINISRLVSLKQKTSPTFDSGTLLSVHLTSWQHVVSITLILAAALKLSQIFRRRFLYIDHPCRQLHVFRLAARLF